MNLFLSDLYRLIRDKALYVLLGIVMVFSFLKCLVYYFLTKDSPTPYAVDQVLIQCISLDILGTIVGIAISLFNGKDFATNTIRNKIGCGNSRYLVFFIKVLENLLITTIFYFVSYLTAYFIGLGLFKQEFASDFASKVWCQYALLIGFSMIITCIVNVTKSTKASIIVTVSLFVLLNAFSYILPTISDSQIIQIICRSLYMVVSTMLVSASDGVYTANVMNINGSSREVITVNYDNLYLNCILIMVVYLAVALIISLIIIRKQDYK